MRQLVEEQMVIDGKTCRCIRCREIKDGIYEAASATLKIDEYEAGEGKEFFIHFEDEARDKLLSLLRLRFSSYSLQGKKHFIPELEGAALVREVHVYGAEVEVGESRKSASQHVGLGRRMLEKAEEISHAAGYKKVAVIAGVGTRNYYRKWGYELEGTYMTKLIV
jgi:elongator complex protein 3